MAEMETNWFDLADVRKRFLAKAVWVPLHASEEISEGEYGYVGWKDEFFGLSSVAVPLSKRAEGLKLGWSDLNNSQGVWATEKLYKPAEIFQYHEGDDLGVSLVMAQNFETGDVPEWHLNQDLVIALELLREGDVWLRPKEDYQEVARLRRDAHGRPAVLEFRNEYLRDYLCARGMFLRTAMFRSRGVIVDDMKDAGSPAPINVRNEIEEYELRLLSLIEGGHFGDGVYSVFHIGRNDVDPGDDVPAPGRETDENTDATKWVARHEGRKLIRVIAELWRNENIEPAESSPRVRRDDVPSGIRYIIDASGTTASSEDLDNEMQMRWLWFKPQVIPNIIKRRGGLLRWYTEMTGGVGFNNSELTHFGINKHGLVNIYAYDIAKLPIWQQRIWSGFNVSPEGGVSAELISAQAQAVVADTTSPERTFSELLPQLDALVGRVVGAPLFRTHGASDELLNEIHRFRALDQGGLLALAKDVMRMIADRIDTAPLQAIAPPPKGEKWGSLKSLEKFLGTLVSAADARSAMGPLFGAYELRVADAHLSSEKLKESLQLLKIDPNAASIDQGFQLLTAVSEAIRQIGGIIFHNKQSSQS